MFLDFQDIIVKRENSAKISLPSFSINSGDKLLLLGSSGAGKTTLLSVLAGLLKPVSGRVLIEGNDFYSMSSSSRDQLRGRDFGFVFQSLHLLPSLTLSQNIVLASDMAGVEVEKGRLNHLLDVLGLIDKADRMPDTLSQGEQQRVAIARAVLLKPKIIIADEPSSALDDDNAQIVINMLEEQAMDTGSALVIATHDNRIKDSFENVINLRNNNKGEL